MVGCVDSFFTCNVLLSHSVQIKVVLSKQWACCPNKLTDLYTVPKSELCLCLLVTL